MACLPWDWEVTAYSLGLLIPKTAKLDSSSSCLVVMWSSDSLARQWCCSGYRSNVGWRQNVQNKFHMPKYVTHYLGSGTWTFFFSHFCSAFNTMRPALLGEKLAVSPQYVHTFKAECQTGPGWVALGPHRGRLLPPPPTYWLYTEDFRVLQWHCKC